MDYGLSSPAFLSVPEVFGSSTLTWILVGVAAYWLALVALRKGGLLPGYVGAQGPIMTIHTKRGRAFLDRLAGPKRFWRAWANLGVGIAIVVMVGMFAMLLIAALSALQAPETTEVQQPQNVLVIPGVNDFLPLSAAPGIVFGLLVGLVVHEGGHGLLCRVEDIDIESMGVAMLAILPIGAFVEPDERDQRETDRGGQTRMFAAGVTFNFAVTIVAFALLFGPIVGAISVAPGAAVGGVAPGSPAEAAEIEPNDRITAVDGTDLETNDDLAATLQETDADEVAVELNDGERTTTVERSVLVTASAGDDTVGVVTGDTIVAVEDEPVATERGFLETVENESVATLTVEDEDGDREDRDVPIGAAVQVAPDGPLATAGGPAGELFVITEIDDQELTTYDDLEVVLAETEPDEDVTVTGYHDGDTVEYDVTLDENPREDSGFLGIRGIAGVSGLSVNDIGIQLYPADEYLALLGGGGDSSVSDTFVDSFLGKIVIALGLPIVGFLELLPFNFAGFTGGIENFYETRGALSLFGDGTVFAVANLLFWTGWINVQLGFFNCIPAFPLDGGHILRTSTEAILSRLPIETTRGMVRSVTTMIGLTMLVSFLLMVFGPSLFAG
ncbi:site-2 protease family protein [Natrialbaceae archaeon AArc-T1-2]|uniref:site-2 protease family protein n=1 Tax=Natrialbaceae archaeon AArc-T1-2 TaxID=3053904 RepID=UPI00255A773E|nr:site-2 protease family protein [Natrialbaceae archaeon AArc-T1-2]WIV66450.1 site-2 protease family protein [Natrialbaceae archaeon AArc-T1-2]